jgi:hypothetical protein
VWKSLGLTLFFALLLTAGCGGSGPIPTGAADSVLRGLDEVEQKVRARDCRRTGPALRRLDQAARQLPESVDEATRGTLTGGFDRLRELVRTQCKPKPKPKRKEPEPVSPSPPAQEVLESAPRLIEPPTQPAPMPEPQEPQAPRSGGRPTPEPQQPTTPIPPQMPGIPETPDVPDLPN